MNDISHNIQTLLDEAYLTRVHDLNKSLQLANKALKISRQINDEQLIGRSLNLLSLFNMVRGQYKTSIKLGREATSYFEKLDDEKGIADAKYNIAGVYYKTDNYHLGLVYLIDCLSIYKKYNDYQNQSRALKSMGTIYEYIGDTKNAIRSYEDSIEAAKKINALNLISNAYNPLSGIYLKSGKIKKALNLIQKSIALKTRSGDIRGLAFALYGRGKIYTKTGQFKEAEQDFIQALDIHTRENETLGIGMLLYKYAVLFYTMSRTKEAKQMLKRALDHSVKYNNTFVIFKSNYLLYKLYKSENDTVNSLKYLERYLEQKEQVINTQTLKVIENYELITKMDALEKDARLQREKAEILEKKEIAEQTAKMKQDFLSTMSHEIRTPLNAVITIAALLSDRPEATETDLFDSLQFASNNLLLIINDILDFTKLDAGKVQLEYRPCQLEPFINQIISMYKKMADEKNISLQVKLDRNIWESYELDEIKMMQILGNLLSNAIKYTEQGSIKLEVVRTNYNENFDTLRFAISDTGVGIPQEYFDQLFDSFSQPKSITTRKQGGSGLGLAIVKKLVELHNSRVHVRSQINKGSVFYFDLKLKKCLSVPKEPLQNLNQLQATSVLLAEDNMINALVARKLLSKWGITAEHAKNGLEAVEMAMQKPYDFILMDIHMPEMNGFDATEQIRNQQNPNHNTPIFALTADITAEQQDNYVNYFNGFLRKPIEIEKLHQALLNVR
ncbi:tetratricopeptide repeat protein [Mucilaginibacter sp. KACC 22063]|uniref:tetratricopeptide repeat protein n=1 Tax=Mucilaginibacter sp. KACC 22063 TaxID=3025666 RepID=UPI0023672245|nr:tetratricopeptide repeat protein [Mucilaginibacter sp. KACC 22063]WDF53608.1 tetratricopeptide repeat protein [Mucilaginibacter sp. KACC 22063]